MPQKIKIQTEEYTIIDAKEKMTVPDCWVMKNKIGKGNGEAKFYIGNESEELFNFFDDFARECFFLKTDLLNYLNEVKEEYEKPQQIYRNKDSIKDDWRNYTNKISQISNEIIKFKISRQEQITPPRVYIKSDDDIYKIIRKISLPNITYLSALKLKDTNGKIVYYWKLFVDYFKDYQPTNIKKEEEKIIKNSQLNEIEKKSLVKARIGQGKYRENLLEECPFCPITMVTDERVLIASHIKPWSKSENNEKIDPKNGFMLTPTFDFLFDKGYITFSNNKEMIVSPWLSKMTCSKLNLIDGKKYVHLPIDEKREIYLEYHRTKIFKN